MPSFFFNDTATTEIYTLSLHDALPIFSRKHLLRLCLVPDRRNSPCYAAVSRAWAYWRAAINLGERRQRLCSEHGCVLSPLILARCASTWCDLVYGSAHHSPHSSKPGFPRIPEVLAGPTSVHPQLQRTARRGTCCCDDSDIRVPHDLCLRYDGNLSPAGVDSSSSQWRQQSVICRLGHRCRDPNCRPKRTRCAIGWRWGDLGARCDGYAWLFDQSSDELGW